MPPRRPDITMRSGRFKKLAAATQRIVKTFNKAAQYRFFNTGKPAFVVTVTPDVGSPVTTLSVKRQSSVDVLVRANSTVTISGTPLAQVEGVYDLVARGAPIRSGRFKEPKPQTDPLALIRARVGDMYRVFNVGDNRFTVSGVTVLPECSTDCAIQSSAPVTITSSEDLPVVGVYDSLESGTAVRSGHFKLDVDADPANSTELEHLLVDVTGCPQALRYRITNSGATGMVFKVVADGVELATLNADQSLDLVVGPGSGTETGYLQVKVTRANKNVLVTGIYDFLGLE